MAPSVAADGIGLSDCWQVIRRRSHLVLALLAVALFATGVFVFLETPNFTASSTLLIEPEPPRVLDIKELFDEASGTDNYDYYKTQFALLKSRDLAANVIRDLDLEHNPLLNPNAQQGYIPLVWSALSTMLSSSPRSGQERDPNAVSAKAIDSYLGRLKVKPKIGTRMVVVSFSAPDPFLARRIVHAHVRHYIQLNIELRNESRESAVKFLQKELVEIKQKVQTSEAALQSYRRNNGMLSFDVQDRNKMAERRMLNLTKALTDIETKRIAAEAQVELVQSGNYQSLPQVIANPVFTALEPRVQQLQAQYAQLAAAFNPEYPKVVELKAQLAAAREGLRKEIHQVATAINREYKADVDEENRLRADVEAEKQRDFALNDASLQDAVLSRDVEANRQLYKNILLRMQQIAVGQRVPVSNISIVDRAVVPALPSSPKKRLDLAISGLIGVLLGIGLAFVLDHLDDRLKTPREAEEYLQLPTLAVAPDFTKLATRDNGSYRLGNAFANVLCFFSRLDLGEPREARLVHHAAARGDVYRSIRTSLLFARRDPPRKVLITSGLEREGKTWTAVQTALAFAQTGARTVLVDADLRRAHCHQALGLENETGLSDILAGRCEAEEAILWLERQNLSLLPAGSRRSNPSELLSSARMWQVLDWLSRQYDYILVDSAPLTCASDTLAIATMTDGVLLVAGARTPKQAIRRASDRLLFVGANVLGVVLNQVDYYDLGYPEYSHYYVLPDDPA